MDISIAQRRRAATQMPVAVADATQKARVRRVRFPLNGNWVCRASRPGQVYLLGDGLHFTTWSAALDYATCAAPASWTDL